MPEVSASIETMVEGLHEAGLGQHAENSIKKRCELGQIEGGDY